MSDELREIFGDNIYSYTRAMAIADGVLIDISEIAKEAGFKIPVAVTEALYKGYIEPSEEDLSFGQSSSGRLWDVLMVLNYNAARTKGDTVLFEVIFSGNEGQKTVKLKAVIGPGDSPDPVVTIILP